MEVVVQVAKDSPDVALDTVIHLVVVILIVQDS